MVSNTDWKLTIKPPSCVGQPMHMNITLIFLDINLSMKDKDEYIFKKGYYIHTCTPLQSKKDATYFIIIIYYYIAS